MALMVYRYRVEGPIPAPVLAEIQRAHILRDAITEKYRRADEQIAELHAAQPELAAAHQAAERAAEHVRTLRDQIQAGKSGRRDRRPDPDLACRLAAARDAAGEARAALKTVKASTRRRLRQQETAIREAAREAAGSLGPLAVSGKLYEDSPVPGALYWASCNTVARQQSNALDRVIARRAMGQPAELNYSSRDGGWDGTGTITVQIRRETGVTAEERAEVARLRAMDMTPGQIAQRTRFSARTVARMKDTGRARAAAPCTPAVLAARNGKWRNVLQLWPYRTEAEWAALQPAKRQRATVRFRMGSGDSASMQALRIVMHRRLPDEAEVIMMQLTVAKVTSTKTRAHVELTIRVPDPEPAVAGGVVAVHTGWRVLPDNAIRVAVIRGGHTPPPGLGLVRDVQMARDKHQARIAGTRSGVPGRPWAGVPVQGQESGLRDHGSWQEIVIPASVRRQGEYCRSLHSSRSREMEQARAAIAAHLSAYPASKELLDPDGTLDKWQSPRRFIRAVEALEAAPAVLPPYQAALLRQLRAWRRREQRLESRQVLTRLRHIIGWRRNMYQEIAAWLAGEAKVLVVDSWSAGRTRPPADEENTPRQEAARANAVLAAPGELRQALGAAAASRGITVLNGPQNIARAHFGCPAGRGELPADERARGVMVACLGCGRQVDQDLNTLAAMVAAAETWASAAGNPARAAR